MAGDTPAARDECSTEELGNGALFVNQKSKY
jgi:hypothetical protein